MNRKRLLLYYASSILLVFSASAAPLVVLPTGDLSCSVEVSKKQSSGSSQQTASASSGGGAPSMKHVDITRVGNLRRDIITWSDGNTTETWRVPDLGVSLVEVFYPARCIYDVRAGSVMGGLFLRRVLDLDPASVDWITSSSLVGKEDRNGKPTIHYRGTVLIPSGSPGIAPYHSFYEAWVDAQTLVPVAFDDGDNIYELTFNAPPTNPLVLPERFRKDLHQYQSAHALARHL